MIPAVSETIIGPDGPSEEIDTGTGDPLATSRAGASCLSGMASLSGRGSGQPHHHKDLQAYRKLQLTLNARILT
jgi:hypothetical protein